MDLMSNGHDNNDFYWNEHLIADSDLESVEVQSQPHRKFGFSELAKGLEIFQKLYSHLQVPLRYPIAEGDAKYPSKLWGLDLGLCYLQYRTRLAERGLKTPLRKHAIDYDSFVAALKVFREIYGHINVPANFIVQPTTQVFPISCGGMELGAIMQLIHSDVLLVLPQYQSQLQELGMIFRKCPPFELLYSAVAKYVGSLVNTKIDFKFTIPYDNADYDSRIWGCELGQLIQLVCDGSLYAEHREKWLELKLPMKTRQMTDRNKRRILYDPTESDDGIKMVKCPKRPVSAKRALPAEEAVGFSSHGLLSKQCNSRRKYQKKQKYYRPDNDDDDDLVSIGSRDDIINSIEAFSPVRVTYNKKRMVDNQSSYEECLVPLIEDLEKLRSERDEILSQSSNEVLLVEDPNVTSEAVSRRFRLTELEIQIERLLKEWNKIFFKFTTEEMLAQRIAQMKETGQDPILGTVTSQTIQRYSHKLAVLKQFGKIDETKEIKEIILHESQTIYRRLYGCRIPRDYKVTSEPHFPDYCWGLPLGRLLASTSLGNENQESNGKMDMVVVPVQHKDYRPTVCYLLDYIQRYIAKNGKESVPLAQTVSFKERNAVCIRGAKVGEWMRDIATAASSACVADGETVATGPLQQQWFNCWKTGSPTVCRNRVCKNDAYEGSVEGMITFGEVICRIKLAVSKSNTDPNTIVPDFVVPECVHYPPECWGLRLGLIMNAKINRKSEQAMKEEKKAIALETYKVFQQRCAVIRQRLNSSVDGGRIALTAAVGNVVGLNVDEDEVDNIILIRANNTDSFVASASVPAFADLEESEYTKQKLYNQRILAFIQDEPEAYVMAGLALKIFRKHHSSETVPVGFVIGETDYNYPIETRGLPFGLLRHWLNVKCFE